jgi:hypothetical protein
MLHISFSDFSIVHFLIFSLLFGMAVFFFFIFLKTIIFSMLSWNAFLLFF